jgi:hypothetical protein
MEQVASFIASPCESKICILKHAVADAEVRIQTARDRIAHLKGGCAVYTTQGNRAVLDTEELARDEKQRQSVAKQERELEQKKFLGRVLVEVQEQEQAAKESRKRQREDMCRMLAENKDMQGTLKSTKESIDVLSGKVKGFTSRMEDMSASIEDRRKKLDDSDRLRLAKYGEKLKNLEGVAMEKKGECDTTITTNIALADEELEAAVAAQALALGNG